MLGAKDQSFEEEYRGGRLLLFDVSCTMSKARQTSGQALTTGPITSEHDRLRAARIAAGYAYSRDAANAVGIPTPTYRNYENGVSQVGPLALEKISSCFSISVQFIREGRIETSQEKLAERIANLASLEIEYTAELASRLRQVRSARGYRTTVSAARAMGWPVATYSAHEAGHNRAPFERLIAYALALGARPEYIVAGELPSGEQEHTGWKDLRARGELVTAEDATAWSWLHSSAKGLPVLTFADGKLKLLGERFSLASELLPDVAVMATTHGYMLRNPANGEELVVIDVVGTSGTAVFVQESGLQLMAVQKAISGLSDPLLKRSFTKPFYLGRFAGTLTISYHAS